MLGEQDYLILWVPNASDSIRIYKGQREKPEFALNHVSMVRGHWEGYGGILQIHFKIRKKHQYLKQELVISTYFIMIAKHGNL